MLTLEELQNNLNIYMQQQNNRSMPEFEGYSPYEMQRILYNTFDQYSLIKLKRLQEDDYKLIPIINQVKYLANIVSRAGEIKLTNKGFLPTKVVAELYNQGFMKEYYIEKGFLKLYKEMDSAGVHVTHVLLTLSGLVKKRNNKISLTKNGEKILSDDCELFRLILKTYVEKFNWAHLDYYGDNKVGQLGFGFSLILLNKYGNEKRIDTFYSQKYFNAYPTLLYNISDNTYSPKERYAANCYSVRTFDRFLNFFGCITIEEERKMDSKKYITKTEIFNKMFEFSIHKIS